MAWRNLSGWLARFSIAASVACCGVCSIAGLPKSADEFFGSSNVWNFHLVVSSSDWDAMMPERLPSGPRTFPRPGEFERPPMGAEGGRFGPPGGMLSGDDYTYVHAKVEIEGEAYSDIGLRYKGNSSFRSAIETFKRPFKLDFNHYKDGQKFLGMSQLNLNNNSMDTSQIREALAYGLFRKAGVPAPRTAFAKVWLTVPGRHERRFLGLYTVVEEVNKAFLKNCFQSAKGLLMKPTHANNMPYLGQEWSAYDKTYEPKTDARASDTRKFIAFLKLIHNAEPAEFQKQIDNFMETDEFLRFIAINAMLANLDSFLGTGHNFFLYLHPDTGRIFWIPWDLNHAFGGFPGGGSAERQMRLSIKRPWAGRNILLDRLFEDETRRKAYENFCKSFASEHFTTAKLHAEIDRLYAAIKDAIEEENRAGVRLPRGPMDRFESRGNGVEQLKTLAAMRAESVAAQLEGRDEGVIPEIQHGPRPFPPPQMR